MNIAFVFDGLGFGGIERVGIDYINICLTLGYDVDVYNLSPKNNALVEQLPAGVKYFSKKFSRKICPELYSYGVQKNWWGKYAYAILSPIVSFLQFIKKLSSKKRCYDVAIAFSGHVNDLSYVAKKFIKAKKTICWCHGNILAYFAIFDAYPILYKKIDKFVVLSSVGQRNIYAGHRFMYDKEIVKIYNPTFINDRKVNENIVNDLKLNFGNFILYVGRFADGKGQDVAIRAMKYLRRRGLETHIVFLGNGNTFEAMKQFAKEQGVDDLCHFEGAKSNVADYITASYINLLTSRWEGLPTVIVEAMTLGKPCVMTNSDDGEVSENGKYCLLKDVDDVDGIVEVIELLYGNKEFYKQYSEQAFIRAEDFSAQKIQKQLIKLLGS